MIRQSTIIRHECTMIRIGLISDTHGLLRRPVAEFLRGSGHIIHAGDICDPSTIDELSTLAPVTAVRGNNDEGLWAAALRHAETILIDTVRIHIVHDIADLDVDPVAQGIKVVVYGHSHKPEVQHRNGVLYVNPGSAGPRRFRLPIAAGELLIERGTVSAQITRFPGSNAA